MEADTLLFEPPAQTKKKEHAMNREENLEAYVDLADEAAHFVVQEIFNEQAKSSDTDVQMKEVFENDKSAMEQRLSSLYLKFWSENGLITSSPK